MGAMLGCPGLSWCMQCWSHVIGKSGAGVGWAPGLSKVVGWLGGPDSTPICTVKEERVQPKGFWDWFLYILVALLKLVVLYSLAFGPFCRL